MEDLELTPYEQTIAMEVVAPEEIPISFDGTWREITREGFMVKYIAN
jgi:hypothetical protein